MKRNLLSLSLFILISLKGSAQCTPVNCASLLPPYGGICDSSIMDGRVNQPYSDFISFLITTSCVDAGTLDPAYNGIGAKMLRIHNFTFTGLPGGITPATSQAQYNAPANGCASFSGIPIHAGVFDVVVAFQADLRTYPFSTTCGGFITLDQNNQNFSGTLSLNILPDPTFTGLNSPYCDQDAPVTLTPTGTTGGTFSGFGVSGNTFDPSLAGAGTHVIKYIVSAQQGVAVGPAVDSSSVTVTVTGSTGYYADADGDGFGNPDSVKSSCSLPSGHVANNLDCNDTNAAINPNTVWFADRDGDYYIVDADSVIACVPPAGYILPATSLGVDCADNDSTIKAVRSYYRDADNDNFGDPNDSLINCAFPIGYSVNNLDCDDTNPNINPNATDIPDNGIDEDCNGSDYSTLGIHDIVSGKFSLHPNPANDHLIIETPVSGINTVVYIYSVEGLLLFQKNFQNTRMDLDVSYFAKGVYLVQVKSDAFTETRKLVIQ